MRIQPSGSRRRAFARWAVQQRPRLRTVGPNAFAVPPVLYRDMPEDLPIGALVNGHRYVPVAEVQPKAPKKPAKVPAKAAANARAEEPPAAPAAAEEVPGGPEPAPAPAPEVDASAPSGPGEDTGPTAPPEPTDPDEPGEADSVDPDRVQCDQCPKHFATSRAMKAHRRQAHPEAVS